MSRPAFGATRVWRHLVMESLPDPPLSAGFHHLAPTYVGAENTRAAPSGPALQGARRQLRLGRAVGLRGRGCAQDDELPRIWRHPVIRSLPDPPLSAGLHHSPHLRDQDPRPAARRLGERIRRRQHLRDQRRITSLRPIHPEIVFDHRGVPAEHLLQRIPDLSSQGLQASRRWSMSST